MKTRDDATATQSSVDTGARARRRIALRRQLFGRLGVGGVTACALSLGVTGAAHGQQQEAVEEIVITGSRITITDGMSTPTPVTTVSTEELASMAPGNLIDAFDQMPQFRNNDSPRTALSRADSAGASNVNMRGLGSQRTLVLLNGRRVVPSNRHSTTDISLFPQSLVTSVEAVTGGASAAYGSDAVAGVVNFLLDTNFTGFRGEVQGGITHRGDDESMKVGFATGAPIGDRMHVVWSADYLRHQGVDNLESRSWYQRQGYVTRPEWQATGEGPRLVHTTDVVSTDATFGGMILAPGSSLNFMEFHPDGSYSPFQVSDLAAFRTGTWTQSVTNGGSGDNFRDARPMTLSPPTQRGSSFANLNFDVTDNLQLNGTLMYGFNRTKTGGTLPMAFGTRAPRIFQDNAFLPEEIRDVMVDEGLESFTLQRWHSREDIGIDTFTNLNRTFSGSVGFDGNIQSDGFFRDWNVNGYYQWGRNQNNLAFRDFIRMDLMPLAVDAVRDPDTGAIVCNVTLYDPSRYCEPLNLFGEGAPSQRALDYIHDDMTVAAKTFQHVAEVTASGRVHEGWGAGEIYAAVGAAYRHDRISQTLSPQELLEVQTWVDGDDPTIGVRGVPPHWTGNQVVPLAEAGTSEFAGGYGVTELFVETLMPLFRGTGAVRDVNLSLAARWADYGGSGSVLAYKGGTDMSLGESLRFRATYSRDVRAANLAERFDSQRRAAPVNDPEFDNEQIIAQQVFGGNPNVDPEEADTLTFGFVYQPLWLEGLSMSVDWFDIRLDGRIASWGTQNIVDDCFAGAQMMCDLISRHPTDNRIVEINDVYLNLHKSRIKGGDLEVRYFQPVQWFGSNESIAIRSLVSYLEEDSVTNLGQPTNNRAGDLNFPRYIAQLGLTYRNGPFTGFVQQRYSPSVRRNGTWVEGVDIADNSIGGSYYTDLRLSYMLEGGGNSSWNLYMHINNLFDEGPARWEGNISRFSGTALPGYEALGRRYSAGVQFRY